MNITNCLKGKITVYLRSAHYALCKTVITLLAKRYAWREYCMDIEVTDLLGVATLATSFLAYIEARKANKNSKCDEIVAALGKVISASEKTQSYLLSRAEGGERNREKEWELA